MPKGWSKINGYLVGPGAYLYRANLNGENLEGVNLTDAYCEGIKLEGAILTDANLTRTNLFGAKIESVVSGGIKGSPKNREMPFGWKLFNGYLIGPKVDLSGANLENVALKVLNIKVTTLVGAILDIGAFAE